MEQLADITVTTETRQDAEDLTAALVEERLAACGNITDVRSIYRWKDSIDREPETLILLHTRASLVPEVIQRVTDLHKYDEPQIVALPVLAASEGYHTWVLESTRPPSA